MWKFESDSPKRNSDAVTSLIPIMCHSAYEIRNDVILIYIHLDRWHRKFISNCSLNVITLMMMMINMLHIRCLIRDDIVADWHLLLCYTLYSAFAKVKEFDGVMNDKVVILLHS